MHFRHLPDARTCVFTGWGVGVFVWRVPADACLCSTSFSGLE